MDEKFTLSLVEGSPVPATTITTSKWSGYFCLEKFFVTAKASFFDPEQSLGAGFWLKNERNLI